MIIKKIIQLGLNVLKIQITLDGGKDYDVTVHDYPAFVSAFSKGVDGLGEAYMNGVWECRSVDKLFEKIAHFDVPFFFAWLGNLGGLKWLNTGSAYEVGKVHYDIGNDLYRIMLGLTMAYTCGVWTSVDTLEAAQEQKFELLCKKLKIEDGMVILDIGIGWAGLPNFIIKKFPNAKIIGLTVSEEQARYNNENCSKNITTVCQDYATYIPDVLFDRIVSVGMFEHVGHKNYSRFFKCTNDWLKPGGILVLHTIVRYEERYIINRFVNKRIFPFSEIPYWFAVIHAATRWFILEHMENLGGINYYLTLKAWWENFDAGYQAGKLSHDTYPIEFYRMWQLYLLGCAGLMKAKKFGIYQYVFIKKGKSITVPKVEEGKGREVLSTAHTWLIYGMIGIVVLLASMQFSVARICKLKTILLGDNHHYWK